MDSCTTCLKSMHAERVVSCSGCRQTFHHTCVGMSRSQFSACMAKIGLLWFCEPCRLNFDPAVYDREKTIMKALRELLIRTDSMDTRLGNYGENLRRINKTLFEPQKSSKSRQQTNQTSFLRNIDDLYLDDMSEGQADQSRSCDETSFYAVLDEINDSIAHMPDRFVVAGKRVQIFDGHSSKESAPQLKSSTPHPAANNIKSNSADNNNRPHVNTASTRAPLKVANNTQMANDVEYFYVTPFEPDQNEDDVMNHVLHISDLDSSLVKVTKLVPRGKRIEDLSFVSFKVTVCKTAATVVGDPWNWPNGITVRPFELNSKNGSAVRLPNS